MKRIVAALFAFSMGAGMAHGAEISGMMGLYQSQKTKGALETTTTSLGVRYGLEQTGDKMWFGELEYVGTSYSGTGAPDAVSSSAIGGGLYYFLPKIETRFVPYLVGFARFESGKEYQGANTVEKSGLYYGSDVGIRFNASEKWFIDFETNLFKSALTATEKTTPTAGGATSETTRMEIYGDSEGAIATMKVGLGMVL